MKSNYEEKTYEIYFNNELNKRSKIFFPPGQVQEGMLGFDSSAFSRNRYLWRRLGYPFWFNPDFDGVYLREIADEMEYFLNKTIENIPHMRANILFQYKRPEFISSQSGKEWKHWNRPYYRYDIYKEQHEILENIHNKFLGKVLVIYASPCATDVNFLIKNRKNIINISNFAKAIDLHDHLKNTYIEHGTYSIACSEPKKIDNINIISMLDEIERNSINEHFSNSENIISFSSKIEQSCKENKYISNPFNTLLEDINELKEHKLLYSFLLMEKFRSITNTQWIIKL